MERTWGGDKHEAQLTYLRLSGKRIGLLVNFNTILLTDGLRRRILEPNPPPPRFFHHPKTTPCLP